MELSLQPQVLYFRCLISSFYLHVCGRQDETEDSDRAKAVLVVERLPRVHEALVFIEREREKVREKERERV